MLASAQILLTERAETLREEAENLIAGPEVSHPPGTMDHILDQKSSSVAGNASQAWSVTSEPPQIDSQSQTSILGS